MSKVIVRGQRGVPIASVASLIAHQSMSSDSSLDNSAYHQVPLYAPSHDADNAVRDDVAVSDMSPQDDEDLSDL